MPFSPSTRRLAALLALAFASGCKRAPASTKAAPAASASSATLAAAASSAAPHRAAPDFSLVDQHGEKVTLATFKGAPFIADFIYTQCTSACPMLTAKMVMLQRRLRDRRVRFVSFSIDPAHDTPAALAAYAKEWNGDESRWSLLATTEDDLDRLSKFHVVIIPTGDPKDPILHSDAFVLVDADGFMQRNYDSTSDAALDQLVADATALSAPASEPVAQPSNDLYASLGCAGCHDRPQVAPPLVNLHGAERMLDDGRKITVDDEYLRRSIVDPSKDRVAGYPIAMPSYRGSLTDAQLDAIVAQLDARVGDAGAPSDNVSLVVDPVCGMKVRAAPDAPHATYQGKDYYFCSESCRTNFVAHPEKYLGDAH